MSVKSKKKEPKRSLLNKQLIIELLPLLRLLVTNNWDVIKDYTLKFVDLVIQILSNL